MRYALTVFFAALAVAVVGCERESPPPAAQPREAPQFNPVNPAAESQPAAPEVTRPPREGRTASAPAETQPGAVQPVEPEGLPTTGPGAEQVLRMTPPQGWKSQPARPMTLQVFTAPKAEGDTEDAEVTVSALEQAVPIELNMLRWCSQFGIDPQTCSGAAKRRTLEATPHPETLVEITGTYRGGGTFTGPSTPKPNYKMLAVEIKTPDRPYYVKLVGPDKTVEHWRNAFLTMVREAK